MKFFLLFLALAIYACTLVHSQPHGDPNLKCQFNCDVQDFKPVCCTNDAGETKTFTNLCIMKIENCLRQQFFQKTADGECP
ncbi:turripeptide Gsg9.2-like [Teleopsis dalmanni]|uniref:turripeptide Gsg9.2 n=1 Tax=Teleopsis dalmanni TaxID=139649 RepID=UPI0018CFA5E4|nr:turripeptide Gsg9.2 [Teleopsis dalmanni]XP_037951484.1 turripeptide Gsg9.2-like [Teleopsis dalmanni]